MNIAFTTKTQLSFDQAVTQSRQALEEQGFGILTQIDVQAAMKAKLGVDVEPYLILGACNPSLAHQALVLDPAIGLLLPCNVTIRTEKDATIVQAMDPQLLVTVVDKPGLKAIADEAGLRLSRRSRNCRRRSRDGSGRHPSSAHTVSQDSGPTDLQP